MTTTNDQAEPDTATANSEAMMQAIVQNQYGSADTFELQEVAVPQVGEDDVLVRIHAAGVNPADWHKMTGTPFFLRMSGEGFRRPKNNIPGTDLAGKVIEVGRNVADFRAGDDVYGEVGRGYAEYVATPARRLARMPENATFVEAAAVPMAALTALQSLRDSGKIKAGDKVLINGASGGVGTFAVQIAKSFGADVTAVCSTRNVDMVRSLGADRVIDYTKEDFTKTGPYDLVLDTVGTRPLAECRRAMTDNGIYVGVGVPKAVPKLLGRMLRMTIGSLFRSKKTVVMLAKATPEDMAILTDMIESGDVTPVIDRTYPLAETAAAMRYQGEGHAQGKTVISVLTDEPATPTEES